MVSYPNKFFHGLSLNDGNSRSFFKYYTIESVHEISDYNGDTVVDTIQRMEDYYFYDNRIGEPYYIIYGVTKNNPDSSTKFIAAFQDLKRAINIVENLTGNIVQETELPVYK